MNNIFTRRFFIWTSILLLAGLIALGAEYFVLKGNFDDIQKRANTVTLNNNILIFTRMFVDKVIKSNGEVDFDTRLKLENSIRNINDEKILAEWKDFIDSKTEVEAQNNVRDLLSILMARLSM